MKEEKRKNGKERTVTEKYKRDGQRKETNTESGARHRIFGDGWRSTVLARVGYPTHLQAVRSASQDLVDYEWTFPLGLEFVLFLIRQA